ncbi:MAG: hypothetical protein AAF558_09820 [Verrucomicrobiota bacterium]
MAGSSRPELTYRIHVEAGREAREDETVAVGLTNPDEIIRIRRLPVLTERYITRIMTLAQGAVLFEFNQTGKHALEVATSTEIGKTLVVLLNGRLIYAAEIDMPLRSGRILIPGEIAPEEVQYIQKYIEKRQKL